MAQTEYNDEQDHDADIAELREGGELIADPVLDAIKASGLSWPSAAQWARARALADAEAWIEHVTAGALDEPEGPTSVEAQLVIEAVAARWAKWIETGEPMTNGVEL